MAKGTGGFAKTGKARPAQFGRTAAGAAPKDFRQTTPKKATAAMQGTSPPSPSTKSSKPPRKDARNPVFSGKGKKVF